jgi:hypothetical protein
MTEFVNSIIQLDQVTLSPSYGSVIGLNDGRLMWAWGSGHAAPLRPFQAIYSDDEGQSWTQPTDLVQTDGEPVLGVMDANLLRLKSGALGLAQRSVAQPAEWEGGYHAALSFHKSEDEGVTWSPAVQISPTGTSAVITNERSVMLKDGRIIVPFYSGLGPKPAGDPKRSSRYGHDFGNAARANLNYSSAYYSDDEGETWTRSDNEAFVVLEQGVQGSYSMGEPTVVELKDGRVLMFGRTNLGRFFQSLSHDRGETWMEPTPTDLACYPSPCRLTRIPSTGDLLVIWNQISRWETMIGLYRHRLSCAVSSDEGGTWRHHRNLESLDDTSYIEPDEIGSMLIGKYHQPVDRQRYHRAPGPLRFNQSTCTFIGDKAVITYGMCVFGDKSVLTGTYGVEYDDLMKDLGLAPFDRGNKVRVVSTDWFYG